MVSNSPEGDVLPTPRPKLTREQGLIDELDLAREWVAAAEAQSTDENLSEEQRKSAREDLVGIGKTVTRLEKELEALRQAT
jgi:hypothetical protein